MHTYNEVVGAFTAAHCTYCPAFLYTYIYLYLFHFATLSIYDISCYPLRWQSGLCWCHSWCDAPCSPDTAGFHCCDCSWSGAEEKGTEEEETPRGKWRTQERSGIIELGGATVEEENTEVHTYDVVSHDTSIDRRGVLYQGLDVETLDYVSEYTELRGGTYQELDLKGREEEHHYQRVK